MKKKMETRVWGLAGAPKSNEGAMARSRNGIADQVLWAWRVWMTAIGFRV